MKPFAHEEDLVVALERTTPLVVNCPGRAHASGEACVICDVHSYGTVEVLLTYVESDALYCASRGLPFDPRLEPRLVKLGLLERSGGRCVATARGSAIAKQHRSALS